MVHKDDAHVGLRMLRCTSEKANVQVPPPCTIRLELHHLLCLARTGWYNDRQVTQVGRESVKEDCAIVLETEVEAAAEMLRESREIAIAAAEAMAAGKGEDIVVLDLSALSGCVDFFVIATGLSVLHMRSLAERVQEELRKHVAGRSHIEGQESSSWMLLDCPSVLVHIFSAQSRDYYGLERLWGDSKVVKWES
ncbi:MAG: ribosome silencing factor [bacterium]